MNTDYYEDNRNTHVILVLWGHAKATIYTKGINAKELRHYLENCPLVSTRAK